MSAMFSMYTTLAAGAKAFLGDQRSAHAGANEAAGAQDHNLDRHVLTSWCCAKGDTWRFVASGREA